MTLPTKPEKPEDWKFEIIDELSKYTDIESDDFDFKKEVKGLAEHICAMANTRGGFIVLGIDPKKSDDGKKVIKFDKIGFENGEQDTIKNGIINQASRIEPTPQIDIENVLDTQTNRFFPVIKIVGKLTDKPFFVKEINQCFFRLNASTYSASRHVILNLYGASFMQIQNIKSLRSSAILLSGEFLKTLDFAKSIHPTSVTRAVPIDLSFIRNAILSNESFLREKGLLNNDSDDMIKMLHALTKFNAQIDGFNSFEDYDRKRALQRQFEDLSSGLQDELSKVKPTLDKVIKICDETLNNNS